jgi:hypothetical protein
LHSAQSRQPAPDFTRNERFQTRAYQCRLFLDSGQPPGFLQQAIVDV